MNRNLVTIGTSAGGVEALRSLLRHLSPDVPAAFLVTIHLSSSYRSMMDQTLSRVGQLPASFATDGEAVVNGHVYLAPPNRHLLLEGERLILGTGPRENNMCPAIDPMFRSVAVCCGFRSIGVVLTGTQGDGASGLWAIGRHGGITVVQDPGDAAFSEMPRAALRRAQPYHVTALDELPELLTQLIARPAATPAPIPKHLELEVAIAKNGRSNVHMMDQIGTRSTLTCPGCGGVMWEMLDNKLTRFRCHVGHAYTTETIIAAIDESLHQVLSSAQRGCDEGVALMELMLKHADADDRMMLRNKAQRYRNQATVIKEIIRRLSA